MQTNSESRTEGLLKDLASDYSSYLVVDASSEVNKALANMRNELFMFLLLQWNKLNGSIRSMSANLEEFTSLLESVSNDVVPAVT